MLFQIEAKQKRLQELYAGKVVAKKVEPKVVAPVVEPPLDILAPAPVLETVTLPKEKSIAITLPVSTHAQAEELMKKLKFEGSKREFFYLVVQSAFEVLEK